MIVVGNYALWTDNGGTSPGESKHLYTSVITSVVVLDVEHHVLVWIVVQGNNEAVCGIVLDVIVIGGRHKIKLGCNSPVYERAHSMRGRAGRKNP